MSKRIKIADLPKFDAARYLNNETAIAAYLTDILECDRTCILNEAVKMYIADVEREAAESEAAMRGPFYTTEQIRDRLRLRIIARKPV